MQNLRTKLQCSKPVPLISYNEKIYTVGSCFAQNIYEKLAYSRYDVRHNSHGILFDPISICSSLNDLLNTKIYDIDDLIYHNEMWHSLRHHSRFSHVQSEVALTNINTTIQKASAHLKKTNTLIITLGTAYNYTHITQNINVANCHKIPQNKFIKNLLSIEEIVRVLTLTLENIKNQNSALNVILTVSPVRHTKEGLINNKRSKARLIMACETIENVLAYGHYFPSYEIMTDDLRDYRFYERDLIHPNSLAIDYIWESLKAQHIDPKDLDRLEKIDQIQKDLAHRPFNPNSDAHKKFEAHLAQRMLEVGF